MKYFTDWEESVTNYYKAKYEREKKEREAKEIEAESAMENEGRSHEQEKCAPKSKKKLSEKEKNRRKIEKAEKERMRHTIDRSLIARETRCGINFTGNHVVVLFNISRYFDCHLYAVRAIVELVRYCLRLPGVSSVLTEHLNQDPIEAFFGRQRMSCGRNDNPSVASFLQTTNLLRIQGSTALDPFRGNCRRRKRSELTPIPVDNTPVRKRKRNSCTI